MSASELSRIVKCDHLPTGPITIEASGSERAALAGRFGLKSIEQLVALVRLSEADGTVTASGTLTANFHQRCAIADEPFANSLVEPLAIRFVRALSPGNEEEPMEFDSEDPDEIEYDGASFDLGEAIAQSLGLAIDPYALGPDADRVRREAGLDDDAAPQGPFAALAALRSGTKES